MVTQNPGSFHLFMFRGIRVGLHWTWFVAAYILYLWYGIGDGLGWFLLTYVSIFAIVLLHEFGHAFACRSVGGTAGDIVLWPLGGIAFVQPPPRPGALLWSIAAGPLVNVALVPVTIGLITAVELIPALTAIEALNHYVYFLGTINLGLLIFNVMPVYPLDGGQMLHAVLWYFMGRSRSLTFAAGTGIVIAVIVGLLALMVRDYWLVLIAVFIGMQAWRGLKIARLLAMYGQ